MPHDDDFTERQRRVPVARRKARPAPLAVDSMGLRARPGAPPLVVRANSIQYNTRPAYLNRQVNRQLKIQRGQQTMITFT